MNSVKNTHALPYLFDELLKTDWFGGIANIDKTDFNAPAINIKDEDEGFIIDLAAPGLVKEDFNIELDNDLLIVSAISKSKENDDAKYTRKDFNYSEFRRSFTLPDSVNGTVIEATYKNGVLSVKLPKKEEAKLQPKRSIAIG